MQYRQLYKTDISLSALGLGCMRLPQDNGKIDRPLALKMMRTAAERGVNYFDSGYFYHGGESETVIGEALNEIGHGKVYVATKTPCSQVESTEDLNRILDDQLKKLGVDTIDFYLLHALTTGVWEKMRRLDVIDFLEDVIKKGKIRYTGFSHHDNTDNFLQIIDDYPKWTVAQTILNYLDDQYQAGLRGVCGAGEKNVGTIVMEPLKGGHLSADAPESVKKLFDSFEPGVSMAEWAFRWAYGAPHVKCILSGMSDMMQLTENLDMFDRFERQGRAGLTEDEQRLFADAKLAFLQQKGVGCTACRYCVPCPENVDIPGVFGNFNLVKLFGNTGSAKMRYSRLIYTQTSADRCIKCGRCENVCPRKLPIMELLNEAHAAMI